MPPSIMQDVWHLAIAFMSGLGGIASSAATTALSAVNPAAGASWAAIARFASSGQPRRAPITIRPRNATPEPRENTQDITESAQEAETSGYARRPRGKTARPARSRGPARPRGSQSVGPAAADPSASSQGRRARAFVQERPAAAAARSSAALSTKKHSELILLTEAMCQ